MTGSVIFVLDQGVTADQITVIASFAEAGTETKMLSEVSLDQGGFIVFSNLDDASDTAEIKQKQENIFVSGNVKDAITFMGEQDYQSLLEISGEITLVNGQIVEQQTVNEPIAEPQPVSEPSLEYQCSDSDEKDEYIYGTVSLTSSAGDTEQYIDYCKDKHIVAEYVCVNANYELVEILCAGMCENGICVEAITPSLFMTQYILSDDKAVVVIGENAPTGQLIGALHLAGKYGLSVVKDSSVQDINSLHAISLGPAFVNSVTAEAINQGAVASGSYYIYESEETGGAILVVAGESAQETRRAVRSLLTN